MNPQTLKILAVEDSPSDAAILRETLLGPGGLVGALGTAETLAEALSLLGSERYDVLLLDLGLPDCRGLETLRRVRERCPEIPIVVLTGQDDEALGLSALQKGAQDYLVKGQLPAAGLARAVRYAMERKRAERLIQALNEELEKKVEDRTRELARANEELEAYSHSVSHDLRAPLRAIRQHTELLESELAGALRGDSRDSLGRIQAGCDRMNRLIDSLLRLSRVNRSVLRLEWLDLSSLAARAVSELREREPRRAVHATIQPGIGARGDPEFLWVALSNLLGNAWKFTGRTTPARIEFGRRGLSGPFFVSDNGAGFDAAHAENLFKPFQRYHPLGEFDGTGVGLATVARVIRRHDGTIWAESEPGKGATFFFTLGSAGGRDIR